MSIYRLRARGDAPVLPSLEAVDQLAPEALVGFATQTAALLKRIRARLALLGGQRASGEPSDGRQHDQWLTPKEAGAYLKLPESWLRDNGRRGRVRSHKRGHYVRFRRSELDEDLQALEKEAEDD